MSAQPVATILYGRNSTDDQAEAGTIENQQKFLHDYASLYQLAIAGEYWDEGISGTVPLHKRPAGQQLLAAVQEHRGATVICYRLDRIGRKLNVILEAHDQLEAAGATIKSASEPFDTSTPFGKAMFQFLGIVAELERSTTLERTSMGRQRVAREGRWIGGTVPYGYMLAPFGEGDRGKARKLILSTRTVDGLDITEPQLMAAAFASIAGGSTIHAECRRLGALGVHWGISRLYQAIKNPTYKGLHELTTKQGPIMQPVPAIVDEATWQRAQAQLTTNRTMSLSATAHRYLLRGLISCGGCSRHYTGASMGVVRNGQTARYYRCAGSLMTVTVASADPDERCQSKLIQAGWLEDLVWAKCRYFAFNPGETLAEVQRQLRAKRTIRPRVAGERRRMQKALAEKEGERERVMTLYRRGKASYEDTERQLDAIKAEADQIEAQLTAISAQDILDQAQDSRLAEAPVLLAAIRARIEQAERTNDWQLKRLVVEDLVAGITVTTRGTGRQKQADVDVHYTFADPGNCNDVVGSTASAPASIRTPRRCWRSCVRQQRTGCRWSCSTVRIRSAATRWRATCSTSNSPRLLVLRRWPCATG